MINFIIFIISFKFFIYIELIIFFYKFNSFDIKPINIAKVISGNCIGLYDVNYRKNFISSIRKWAFNNNILPDSILFDKMNSLLKQITYSGKKEYNVLKGNIPIVKSTKGLKFKFDVNLPGENFYLFITSSEDFLKSFIESKVSNGFKDALHDVKDEFTCYNEAKSGTKVVFLISIDKNYKYKYLPVGVLMVDKVRPDIYGPNEYSLNPFKRTGNYKWKVLVQNDNFYQLSYGLIMDDFILHFPNAEKYITSSCQFKREDEDDEKSDIKVFVKGDYESITIGKKVYNRNYFKEHKYIKMSFYSFYDKVPISIIDKRGNKNEGSISCEYTGRYYVRSYDDNDEDYEELESRINDLESKINELEEDIDY